jgi:hypothetical protein
MAEARADAQRATEIDPLASVAWWTLGNIDLRRGACQLAQVRAWSGDVDGAFSWLGRAFAEKDAGLNYVRHDPLLAKLRGDPRWTALLNKMKLPVE